MLVRHHLRSLQGVEPCEALLMLVMDFRSRFYQNERV
ncbi:MAG: hypothetical protein M2R45_00449 [Verrucomicrobia subdivision 3 bacterium]|nr:hypothetical protein [Limisphaerales bacterium]MCS1413671.1 hypothetical protein [Limisphaerales bacterium]